MKETINGKDTTRVIWKNWPAEIIEQVVIIMRAQHLYAAPVMAYFALG